MDSTVATFYQFADLPDFEAKRAPLKEHCERHSVQGTIILAHEGINGTIAGPSAGVESVLGFIRGDDRLAGLSARISDTERITFHRMKVVLRPEIVTLGAPEADPREAVGEYVEPSDWNTLISDPGVTVVDTRNDYEVGMGTFRGAIDPKTGSFGEWPEYVQQNLDPKKHPKIAMFCTGGIRCEKASAYLLKHGFREVFHLRGGILNYLQKTPEAESLWEGDCFVFDHRVSVKHGLEQGAHGDLFRLPLAAHGRGDAVAAIRGRRELSALRRRVDAGAAGASPGTAPAGDAGAQPQRTTHRPSAQAQVAPSQC